MKKMKLLATGLLILMAIIFCLSLYFEHALPWLRIVRAFAEASMIGALADWFAVVVLFRHPFGIPIPHTAIIPKSKYRIGKILGKFVVANFITEEVIKKHFLNKKDFANAASRLLEIFTAGPAFDTLSDKGFAIVRRFVRKSFPVMRYYILKELPVLWPEWFGKKEAAHGLAKHIIQALQHQIDAIEKDPNHATRKAIQTHIKKYIDTLKTSSNYPEDQFQKSLHETFDSLITTAVAHFAPHIQKMIENTVSSWSESRIVETLEPAVGRDLQFIRINGTIVGGLAGLAIYGLSLLFPH